MTALAQLYVMQFVTMLWVGGVTLWIAFTAKHVRKTRHAVLAAFRGGPNPLRLPPVPPPAAPMRSNRENGVPTPPSGVPVARPARGPDDVVAPPPTVDGDTVRDFLRYFARRRDEQPESSWDVVVAEFYRRAASYPHIAAYFTGVDLDKLQRHFVAAMIMVTNSGLNARTVQSMTIAHAGVRTPDGAPITGQVYDQVVDVLVEVLVEHGVPNEAINELARVIDPLRAAIVVNE